MDIQSIKLLMKVGEFARAREFLGKRLEQVPDDEVAQMLYGTCCQIMGDTETFGRIYQRLAPEMERCVKRGEKSERTAMWVKYAAMFMMLLMCGTQLWARGNYYTTLDDDDDQVAVMSTSDENGEFGRVMKMSLKEKFRYFLERQDVKEQLYRGAMRAVVIPLQSPREYKEQENLLIIARKAIQNGADVVQNLKAMSKMPQANYDSNYSEDDDGEPVRKIPKVNNEAISHPPLLCVAFSPFERIARADGSDAASTNKAWRFNGFGSVEQMGRGLKKTIESIEKHGDISDLIVSSEDPDWLILGVCFVNVKESSVQARYAGPRDYGGRYPRRVATPSGKVIYELTEEMVRKEMAEKIKAWNSSDRF